MKIFKVSSTTDCKLTANAIAHEMRKGNEIQVDSVGALAVNQAIKAITIARSQLVANAIDIVIVPAFETVDVESGQLTKIKLILRRV